MPLKRKERLEKLAKDLPSTDPYLFQEIQKANRRLTERGTTYTNTRMLEKRWRDILYSSIDGRGLRESAKVPQQHQWITSGNRLLSGRDYINSIKLRINALPTRSRTSRGRPSDRTCRAGCNAVETLAHVLQQCHRTHKARIDRHNAVVSYIKRAASKQYNELHEEPQFKTLDGIRKPDLVVYVVTQPWS